MIRFILGFLLVWVGSDLFMPDPAPWARAVACGLLVISGLALMLAKWGIEVSPPRRVLDVYEAVICTSCGENVLRSPSTTCTDARHRRLALAALRDELNRTVVG